MLLTAFDFLGNQQEAEDIVSSVFEKIWRSKDRCLKDDFLNDQHKLKCYLSMAIKNACIDLHRKKKRQTAAFINFSRFQPLWKRPDVYDKFEEEALRLLMLELSKREKEVILLFLRGQNNADIALHLKISELTVRNTLQNARSRIRRIWNIFMR